MNVGLVRQDCRTGYRASHTDFSTVNHDHLPCRIYKPVRYQRSRHTTAHDCHLATDIFRKFSIAGNSPSV